ncbi:hypothetical protein IMCC9480_1518 [Oxalobacteraceae bacterium IMCC9480]|nr:hypothetical protein IMCC9480_1518 [Oxalobacteraceae bacterium IMCC9480]
MPAWYDSFVSVGHGFAQNIAQCIMPQRWIPLHLSAVIVNHAGVC